MRRCLHRLLPFAIIGSLAAAACGAAQVAPTLAVRQAAAQVGHDRRTNVVLSLSGRDDDAVALFNEGEDGAPTAEDRRQMLTMFHSQLRVAVDEGADATSTKDDASAFDVKVGDIDQAVEIRQVADPER